MYTKTKPNISFIEFIQLAGPVVSFNSLEGYEYVVKKLNGSTMHFIRTSTGALWDMDLKQVHKAYLELKDFKTKSFEKYVPRRHSPALGLLFHLKLLVR
ncbi:hypothetical protein [Arenibacter sp. F20364]|uniref:hypothetical protein n=1 Tax=Arenibacter sp. F20364 TaxID=2926415 RepID=UPI001FF5DB41|nr:hypothetical protein [Arenibacter sp. F20364]MCK0190453.1 hypothetical protein [Arenibacter sp. F20364]